MNGEMSVSRGTKRSREDAMAPGTDEHDEQGGDEPRSPGLLHEEKGKPSRAAIENGNVEEENNKLKNEGKIGDAFDDVGVDDDDDDDAPVLKNFRMPGDVRKGFECPYLDTISRQNLDFDFEKCCSVSLSRVNVYVCLVCGKYFQGRGPSTHAYTHALEAGHHLFMKLDSGRTYCLPDMYEVDDKSLSDIQYVLNPTYKKEDIATLNSSISWARALDGSEYMPGLVGLNNIRANDYANAIFQVLIRISPVRDFFLSPENYSKCNSPLVHRFGEFVRKVCNPKAFKGQVSPHELLQAILVSSDKKFQIEKQSDPADFFAWIVNSLHIGLTGGKRKKPSIITKALQGQLEITSFAGTGKAKASSVDIIDQVPFFMLALDLPPIPLYKDSLERVTIPQIPVYDLLHRYDGETIIDDVKAGRRCFRIINLPPYLVLHMRRFVTNQFFIEKNPTIVTFPVKKLDVEFLMRGKTKEYSKERPPEGSSYNLVANVVHDGNVEHGNYRVHIHRQSEGTWYEVQDLSLTEVLPQVVALSEAYLQVYERMECT